MKEQRNPREKGEDAAPQEERAAPSGEPKTEDNPKASMHAKVSEAGDLAHRLASRFAGSERAHYVFKPGQKSARGKVEGDYAHAEGAPSLEAWRAHLDGEPGLLVVPVTPEGTCRFGAIDVDDYDGLDLAQEERKARELGLPLVPFRSKSGGAHLYLFLADWEDASRVRALLRRWATALGYEGAEVFPKQDRLGDDEAGNGLNMPYFRGEVTDRYAVRDGDFVKPEELHDLIDRAATTLAEVEAIELPDAPREKPFGDEGKARRFQLPEVIPEGQRDETLFKYGCSLRARGWADDEALRAEVKRVNEERVDPPLDERQVEKCVRQVLRYEAGSPPPPELDEMNEKHAVVMEGGKTVILNLKDWDPAQKKHVLTRSRFSDIKHLYANRRVVVGEDNNGNPKYRKLADWWLEHPERREFQGVVFAPGKEMLGWYNLWQGFSVTPRPGSWTYLEDLLRNVICGGVEEHYRYLIRWMALTVQQPDEIPEVAVVMRGRRGTGKGTVARVLMDLMREHSVHVSNPEHVSGKFNAHLQGCVICFADEAFWAGDKRNVGSLKHLITEPTLTIEAKHQNPVQVKNAVHLLMASNEDWVVPAGENERRFFMVDVSDARMQDQGYFKALNAELDQGGREAFLHDLLQMDLSDFDPRDFPRTEALEEQQERTLGPVEAFWKETLERGTPLETMEAWEREVVREDLYNAYLEHAGKATTRAHLGTETAFGMTLRKMLPAEHRDANGKIPYGHIRVERTTYDDEGNPVVKTLRKRTYKLPSLAECRAAFEHHVGHAIDWPEEPEPEAHEIPF